MPVLTVRDRQRQAREEAILDAAEELMATRGYLAMTMDDLAASLNVSKATLYQHFRSKEDMAVSVLTRIIRRGLAHVRSLDPGLPPLERLEATIAYIVRRRYAERHVDLSNQIPTLLPVLMKSPQYQAVVEEIVARLSGLLEQAKREGTADPSLSTPVLIEAFLGLVRNTDYQPLIDAGQCTAEDVRRTLTALVLRGVRPAPGAADGCPVTGGDVPGGI